MKCHITTVLLLLACVTLLVNANRPVERSRLRESTTASSRRLSEDSATSSLLKLRGGTTDTRKLLNAVDLFGTGVFAFSGALTAGRKGMDLLGIAILATVTSVGGGTIRDVMLGSTPVFWMKQPIYLEICVVTAIATYLVWPALEKKFGLQDSSKVICVSDALGLAAFAVIGTQKAADMNLNPLIWIVSGLMTATFGGITRDTICQEPPRSIYPQCTMYAVHPMLGSAVYAALYDQFGVKQNTATMIAFVLICTCRILSFDRATRLPHWNQKSIEVSN